MAKRDQTGKAKRKVRTSPIFLDAVPELLQKNKKGAASVVVTLAEGAKDPKNPYRGMRRRALQNLQLFIHNKNGVINPNGFKLGEKQAVDKKEPLSVEFEIPDDAKQGDTFDIVITAYDGDENVGDFVQRIQISKDEDYLRQLLDSALSATEIYRDYCAVKKNAPSDVAIELFKVHAEQLQSKPQKSADFAEWLKSKAELFNKFAEEFGKEAFSSNFDTSNMVKRFAEDLPKNVDVNQLLNDYSDMMESILVVMLSEVRS